MTIFGMSAGGVSVNYHLAMPASAGLFHRETACCSSSASVIASISDMPKKQEFRTAKVKLP